jgi:1,4-dihydroxy-2-naphthoate octaprenyltransferase
VRAEWLSLGLVSGAYAFAIALVALRVIPFTCVLVLAALPIFLRKGIPTGRESAPPEYGARAQDLFLHSVAFSILLAAGLLI